MVIYILSIVFFIFVLLKGIGETGFIPRLLITLAIILAGYNLYMIFTGELSDIFFINLLLSIIPGIALIVSTAFLFDTNSFDTNSNNNNKNTTPHFNVNIVDNETTNTLNTPQYASTQSADNFTPQQNKIFYKNARIDGYGTCDVTETDEYIKITMKSDGKEYNFYMQGPNIVGYSTDKISKPQNY